MKRKFMTIVLSLGVVGVAHAQLGGLLGGGKASSGGGDVSAMVDQFNADSALISGAVSNSLTHIVAALGNKEQIAVVKAKYDSLEKTTDTKEKASIQGAIIKEQAAVAQQLVDSKESKAKMEQMEPETKKKVAASILNIGIAGLKVPGMLDKGKKAIEGVSSNPMMVSKIVPVKDGVALFGETLPKLTKIASVGFQLMKDVKVDAGNPAADAKMQDVGDPFAGLK